MDIKKSRFIKNQEAKELLNNLGIRTTLSKVPLLGDTCFNTCLKDTSCEATYKMNEIVNKFLLVGDKFMPEMHLRQSAFKYIVFVNHLQKTKKEYKI